MCVCVSVCGASRELWHRMSLLNKCICFTWDGTTKHRFVNASTRSSFVAITVAIENANVNAIAVCRSYHRCNHRTQALAKWNGEWIKCIEKFEEKKTSTHTQRDENSYNAKTFSLSDSLALVIEHIGFCQHFHRTI